MIRLLHILPADADFGSRRARRNWRGLGADFDCRARTVGVGGNWRSVPAAILAIRRERPFDLIHCWGMECLAAAAIASSGPIVYSPQLPYSPRDARWLRAAMAHRDVHVVLPTLNQHRELVTAGIPIDRCRIIAPGVDLARRRKARDPALRDALGLAQDDCVILAVGEATEQTGHALAVWTIGILNVLDPHYRLLVWGRGPAIAKVKYLQQRLVDPAGACLAEQTLRRPVEFEQLLSIADLALIPASGAVDPLPICACMAAGLPIISTITATTRELLEPDRTAVLLDAPSPRLIAQHIIELREDRPRQLRLGDEARSIAYERFSLSHSLQAHRELYRRIAGGAIAADLTADPAESPAP